MTGKFDPERLPTAAQKIHRRFLAPCSFCRTYAADRSVTVAAGDRETYICAVCVADAARLLEQLPPSRGRIVELHPNDDN